MTIAVTIPESDAELYHRYPGQSTPQGVYLELDPETGAMSLGTNYEIGNAVPASVWNCRVHRYPVPGALTVQGATVLLAEASPLAERIVAGYECVWDGSNFVGRLTDEATQAGLALLALAASYGDEDQLLQVWAGGDWLQDNSDQDLGLTRASTDDDIETLAERLDEEAWHDQAVHLDGTEEELFWRRERLRDEPDEDDE